LDGHELQLKFSNAASKEVTSRKRTAGQLKEDSTKLLVKNLPFQATRKDLKTLFSYHCLTRSFGALKTVRIPHKFDGTHRGFAFVDFLTPQEAQNAYQSLGATHLYGRHLVLEWAKEEDSIEEMRSKTAKSFVKDGKKHKSFDEEGVDDEY
jgi:multiple RNA-binding domain-containing protein 1